MDTWSDDELDRIGTAEELRISSRRSDGSFSKPITIWVVRVGDDLFVRSAYGADNPWFANARRRGAGRISAVGVERTVAFEDASDASAEAIDAAYHAKYDPVSSPRIVATVVGERVHPLTIRLVPRSE
ncbi:DUF2255 family protein [Agromyces sp. CFH 90414]|uniref:DUF2255 family protein n=1 Tax=Agromyces agglutinans TaxID=2662258 RepID=A0A6I2F208_9MICO|nr:DUF2255 family protein [Agromyces agglutinans]MRG58464.1 DUF2255 family protein [Agromyces agglutinans]